MARDWLNTLWPASYNGASFFVERDKAEGGRRIVIHEFPHRDDTFNEDIGDGQRTFHVTAYLVGDRCDKDADALIGALSKEGAGTLVLPDQGQIQCRAMKPWSRERDRDHLGIVRVEATFVREGQAQQVSSSGYLQQLAFDGVDTLATAIGTFAAQAFDVVQRPNWVAAAASDAIQAITVELDAVLAEAPADPQRVNAVADSVQAAFDAVPDAVSPITGIDAGAVVAIVAVARSVAEIIAPAASAISALSASIDLFEQPPAKLSATANAAALIANAAAAARLARLTLLAAYTDAVLSSAYESRSQAIETRARLVARFSGELALCTGAANLGLSVALQGLRGAAIDYLSKLITDLKPVLTVTSTLPLPSLVFAWQLYQDPTRAPEIVARNHVKHPSFMPERFEALSPAA